MRKYYVEIYDRNDINTSYLIQSVWFKTYQEAKEWKDKIGFMLRDYRTNLHADVMVAEFSDDGETYDILGAYENYPDE